MVIFSQNSGRSLGYLSKMKFHLFLGNPCSSDFETRLGHEETFEVDSWEEFLVQLVEWKIEHLDNEELTKDDLQDEFIWNLC